MSAKRPNILLITSDQQRADCYGFEDPNIKTPHLDSARARRHALLGVHHAQPRVPAVARVDPHRAAAAHARRVGQRRRSRSARGRARVRRHARRARAIAPRSSARRTSRPSRPSSRPARRSATRARPSYGPDWFGPYMGFEHVELCVLGHLHRTRPLERPPVGHYERWLLSRGENEEAVKLWAASTRPTSAPRRPGIRRCRSPGTRARGSAIARSISCRSHDKSQPFCAVGVVSRSAPSVRLPRAVEPACTTRRASRCRSIARATSSAGRGGTRPRSKARRSLQDPGDAQVPRRRLARAGPDRRAARGHDRQLLRHDLADRPQRRPHPQRARRSRARGGHARRLHAPITATARQSRPLPQGPDAVRGPAARRRWSRAGPAWQPDEVVDEPVSTLDLAATFYDYAGVSPPHAMQSRSLVRLLARRSRNRATPLTANGTCIRRAAASACSCAPCAPRPTSARSSSVRARASSTTSSNDPGEMDNRFDDPGCAKVRKELEDMMRARPGKVRENLAEPIGMA